jgi:hypothetical protein
MNLVDRAKQYVPEDREVAACWEMIARAIDAGWLDAEEMLELLEHLRAGRDFGVEELLFAHVGDRLRVSFLDDRVMCAPAAMLAALSAVVR